MIKIGKDRNDMLSTLKKSRLNKRLMEARIINYESMVGEKFSRFLKPIFIQNNTLFIGLKSYMVHQLHF